MSESSNILLQKLDAFIRKYYVNQMLRGSIYFVGVLLVSIITLSVIEYFGNFGKSIRAILFYSGLLINLILLAAWVLIPLLKLQSIGPRLSYKQAAIIVGNHFTDIKDKLLNALQLHETNAGSMSLIQASIQQKIDALKPVPFTLAIDFKKNRKYLKYAVIPILIFGFMLIQIPDVILKSSARIVTYSKDFIPEAPFEFNLLNEDMKVLMHEDVEINLELEGEQVPNNAFVIINGVEYRMRKKGVGLFSFTLKNVEKTSEVKFSAQDFYSDDYRLTVLPKPFMKWFEISLEYPKYIEKRNEITKNIGDINIPEGTIVEWNFHAANSSEIKLRINNKLVPGKRITQEKFSFKKQIFNASNYYVQSNNEYVPVNDSMEYGIQVVKDLHPSINVELNRDSNSLKTYFFSGDITDDYGINGLNFFYRIANSDDNAKVMADFKRLNVPVKRKAIQSFFHYFDANSVGYEAGDELEFYFEVWDNDGVNGNKSSKSKIFKVAAPGKEAIKEMVAEQSSDIKQDMKNLMKEASKMKKELDDVKTKLLDKKKLEWEDKKALNNLLEKQKSLKKQAESMKEKYKDMLKQQDEFNKMDDKLRKKHEELMKLFDQLMDEDMKKLYDELQKMLEENKDNVKDKLDDIKLENDDLEKELDAALEHFKQLEFEQKMDDVIKKLDELAKKQEDLAKKTEDARKDEKGDLEKKQEDLNKEFDKLQKDMEDLKKKNEALENPNKMEDTKGDEESIKEEMKQGKDEISKGKNKKASEKQKKASDKMKELQKKMESMKSDMEKESLDLDYEALRKIMENLIYVSFDQENLLNDLQKVHTYNPKFVELAQKQMKIKGDAKMIEDSLIALSKKVMQISGFINKEVGKVNYNMEKTINNLSERNIGESRKYQQYVMTHLNNLAVMLSEVMQQMQQDMAKKKKGSQNCQNPKNKPGQGQKKPNMKKKMGNMRQMQEQLKKQLGEMKQKMGKGERPLSKELAKMAAQQEALRKELQKINEMKEGAGETPSDELKKIEELMNETEKDIVNQRITNETLKRQQEIITKLLESEKAEREEEFDNERESKTGNQIIDPSKKAFEAYKKAKMREIELLNSVPPQLNGYYKGKVKEYFKELN